MTGCDSNSRFYGHRSNSIYDKISRVSHLGHLIIGTYIDIWGQKSETPGEARSVKWKSMKKKSRFRLCPDDDILDHYCERANYLSYNQLHPEVYNHPSPLGHGWMLVDGRCHLVRNRLSTLPNNV